MTDRRQQFFKILSLHSSASKTVIFLLILALVVITFSLSGCKKQQQVSEVDKAITTPTEQKKSELLQRIDKKFEDPQAHYELGKIYQDQGSLVRAEYEYNVALSFDPSYRQAQAGLVKVLLDSGDVTKSKLSADIYINQTSASAVESIRLALAFQHQSLDEYALTCYRQALALAPNSAKVNRQIAYYYLSKGDKERAKDYLVRSYQIDPYQAEVAGELGRLGVEVKIPRKTESSSKELDKMLEESDEQLKQ
ncbi:MAG: tetratricopeptide repeat protein [Planctomycetota bacterium]|jgi:Flp pilus assembly protein TadD